MFQRDYLSNPEYIFERINRANITFIPMLKWAIAQLEYAEMLYGSIPSDRSLRPLRMLR